VARPGPRTIGPRRRPLGALGRRRGQAVEARLEQALDNLADAHDELARRQSFTNALLETIEVGIVSCDAEGVFFLSNRAQREMFGLVVGLDGMLPEQLGSLIDVFDAAGIALAVDEYPLMRTLRGQDVSPADVRVGPAGGPYREVVVRASRIIGSAGELLGAVAALTDMTAERTASRALTDERRKLAAAEESAQRANTFLNAVLSATPDYTFVTDLTTGAIIYGSRDRDVLGISSEKLQAMEPHGGTALIHPDDHVRLLAVNVAAADLEDGQVLQLRYRGMHADGQWRWLNRRVTPFRRNDSGHVVEVLGVVRDVTDVVQAEDRLTHATLHDDLTGLPNRALLVDRLDAALTRSERDGQEVAVLFCDLDGFKNVNDTAGHAAGDVVLLEIARRLNSILRDGDTVARVGGDEFVIVVEPWSRELTVTPATAALRTDPQPALAVVVAERVAAVLRPPVTVNDVDHVVTASIGITYARTAPRDVDGRVTADEVLQDADAAMYLAKGLGKDRFEIFERDRPRLLPPDRVESVAVKGK
jgi:diguanylate cyclase (GGDEF)-like protein/PAS domain S-box-containing protein